MKDLENLHIGKSAIIIFGGPSVISYLDQIKDINREKFVIFLESKSLTPFVVNNKIPFDYLLATFPQKLKDNSLQNYIFRSLLSRINIKYFIKKEFYKDVDFLLDNFDLFLENHRPKRGIHKRFRFKNNIYLPNSPFDVLNKLKNKKIITNYELYKKDFGEITQDFHKFYYIKHETAEEKFNMDKYFNPKLIDNFLSVSNSSFMNSAAINYYPIVKFMGFKKIYFAGMDMNMLGNIEYSALRIFKNMKLFSLFIFLCRKSFSSNFKINFPFYLRPKYEIEDLRKLNMNNYIDFYRITNNTNYEYKDDFLKSLSFEEFITYN